MSGKPQEDDIDDLPPLEDMSDVLNKAKPSKNEKRGKHDVDVDYTVPKEVQDEQRQKEIDSLDKSLAKGLLNTQGKVKDAEETKKKAEEDAKKKKNPLEIQEVQENMKKDSVYGFLENNKEKWMTPGLIGKLQQNPKLLQGFADPEVMMAVVLMQSDPSAAKEKYKNNKKVTDFFVEFTRLMGGHFEELDSEGKKTESKQSTTTQQSKPAEIKPVQSKPTQQLPFFSTTDPVLAKKLEDPTVKVELLLIHSHSFKSRKYKLS